MQNPKTKDFVSYLKELGYEELRKRGSHTVYGKKVTHTVSLPTSSNEINGALAKAVTKEINSVNELFKKQ